MEIEKYIKTMFTINNEITNVSLPVKLGYTLYLSKDHNDEHEFFKKICALNGKYKESIFCLDDLRNKLAHTGSSISDDNFSKLKNYIAEIEEIISPEVCSYDIQNEEIAKLIDKYKQPALEN